MDVDFRRRLVEEIEAALAAEAAREGVAAIVERTMEDLSRDLVESGVPWGTAALVAVLCDRRLPASAFAEMVDSLRAALRTRRAQIRSPVALFWGMVTLRLKQHSGLKWSADLLRRIG